MIINENSIIHKFMEKHSKCIDEYIKERENYENCEKTVESPDKNTVNNTHDNDENKTPETGKNGAKKSVFGKIKEGGDTNKKKAFNKKRNLIIEELETVLHKLKLNCENPSSLRYIANNYLFFTLFTQCNK